MDVLLIVKPDTVVAWHRAGFRRYWRWKSGRLPGRRITVEIRDLLHLVAEENAGWGAPKIHGELQKLGFEVSERTVARYLRRLRRRRSQKELAGLPSESSRGDRRPRLLHRANGHLPPAVLPVNANLLKGLNVAILWLGTIPSMRDVVILFVHLIVTVVRLLGPVGGSGLWSPKLEVKEIKTVPYVLLSHPFVERLIGTVRREYLDRILFWSTADLVQKLLDFSNYYS